MNCFLCEQPIDPESASDIVCAHATCWRSYLLGESAMRAFLQRHPEDITSEAWKVADDLRKEIRQLEARLNAVDQKLLDHEWRLPSDDPDDYPQNDR